MKQLEDAIQEGQKNKKNNISQPKITLYDKIKGIKGALKRIKESGVFNPDTYCSEKEAIERIICCTTCTDKATCPYCGCAIKAKRLLNTESCPNPETYPHLKKFPPKNYWEVCSQSTAVVFYSNDEKEIDKLYKDIIENSTGKISFWLITENNFYKKNVNIVQTKSSFRETFNVILKEIKDDYLFFTSTDISVEKGWDTKLKCICDKNVISTGIIQYKNKQFIDGFVTEDMKWEMNKYLDENTEKIQEIFLPHNDVMMIRKSDFLDIEKFNIDFDGTHNLNIELSAKIKQKGGIKRARKDIKFISRTIKYDIFDVDLKNFFCKKHNTIRHQGDFL